ncbi:Fe-S cluster assembly ATPase SufC [Candidatus Liberibacter africanus]|uniref:ABC transporter nucleotide binding/ATPase protein n=1 Tax=Candidatus Liberibacter africanus PTSAPSY TaxID=1277257 RepID=A0A0G3I3W8_LIBAF|nr:Fe-S cluster assembly ATPase SufC [Candidatus Liberibacter africanus]AKK20576.1 ABC transporter nucleotide binding/ATPase protein [Candidatus Liberibacter africanus PTSAPSY]QTP64272.1 Fe-S cluster assembly ATPase SufC [Candidatus Liberibacter africanus]
MLEIKNLHAKIVDTDTEIIRGLDLKIDAGEIVAIMGPNGSGKSTLSYILSGHKDYEITSGDIIYKGNSILDWSIAERASKGIFLAFQYPVEIPGVVMMQFLKTALNEQRKARNEEELSIPDFTRKVREISAELGIKMNMLKRPLNLGFSGGEKKIAEILQMRLLEPSLCILDETDSGLDIDALKVASHGVNALRLQNRSFLIITHYQRLLNYIKPDTVHVLYNGKIVKTGDYSVAIDLEMNGYADLIQEQV